MHLDFHRHRLCAVAALAMLSLTACSGLPKGGGGPARTPLNVTSPTKLGAAVQAKAGRHPGLSGLHSLADARDALAARLALADAAQRSLDVQYFIWNKDMAGRVMIERLFRAADRGVRVRLLLDDLGTMPGDRELLAIDSHPNIEVRMFNPVGMRSLRVLGMLGDFARINKRMHNKSFTADGRVAIVGGRNIGDEYFGASTESNFADLDVAVIGPVVQQVQEEFDLYWNHAAAVPISALSSHRTTPKEYAAWRAKIRAAHQLAERSSYADTLRDSTFVRQLQSHSVSYYWGRATIVSDHPDKVLTSSDKTHLAPKLREVIEHTRRELFLVSPYFVPGKQGVARLTGVHQRGPRVVVITNSLASTDGVPVHSGYERYRKPLIEGGVELYELKPTVHAKVKRFRGGLFGSRGASASSGASLHAKTFSFDRERGFIGSYNLDPRSSRLNTEMGVLFDCPALAKRLPENTERYLMDITYRVELEGNRLVWVTREDGQEVRYYSEPDTSLWKRLKVRVLSWLPLESLL